MSSSRAATIAGTKHDRREAIERALAVGLEAAKLIMRVYATPFTVDYKGKDDPVTRADREANALIVAALSKDYPEIPIVAEESDPKEFAGFTKSRAVWFVDPLDGTREFVAKNGEFSVMIGLAEDGRATAGVLVNPGERRCFVGVVGAGAFEVAESGGRTAIHVTSATTLERARVVVSRSRKSQKLDAVLAALPASARATPTGSSGVKAARVAVGEAEIYLQPGMAGKRWDACAPEAIVRAAGGMFTDVKGDPFDYATEDLENRLGIVATSAGVYEATMTIVRSVLSS